MNDSFYDPVAARREWEVQVSQFINLAISKQENSARTQSARGIHVPGTRSAHARDEA